MYAKEIYEIWAKEGCKWTEWVRPVPFVVLKDEMKYINNMNLEIPKIHYMNNQFENAGIIVDMPDVSSVAEGLVLANYGYRPIPIYNGTMAPAYSRSTTDNFAVSVALAQGAKILEGIDLKNDALPAFLLDTNRLNRYKRNVSIFDNSWDVYPQDLPSAKYLKENNIEKVMVVSEKISKDLAKILKMYQQKKIDIYLVNRYSDVHKKYYSRISRAFYAKKSVVS